MEHNKTTQTKKKLWHRRRKLLIGILFVLMHSIGFISSVNALMSSRTSTGAVAWIVSLNTFPYVAVPAYWLFGSPKFQGKITDMRQKNSVLRSAMAEKHSEIEKYIYLSDEKHEMPTALEKLSRMRFATNNAVELLIDGHDTYESIFKGIESAKNYLLVQFYIIKDDSIGNELKKRLIAKAQEGVNVYFMYDAIGSRSLSRSYIDDLSAAGVKTGRFRSSRSMILQFQINFRNHRKIVVADGSSGWAGGLNVADEYVNGNLRVGSWRDTHLKIEGPSVLALQLSFVEDWYWITGEIPELEWSPQPSDSADIPVIVIPSGPADRFETASLMMQHVINSAKERIWIASPYFVPDEGVMNAIKIASFRGVDVRIIIPEEPDLFLVYYAAYAFIGSIIDAGASIYRYQDGFLHGKTFLADDLFAGIGTVNLDNRSFRLNFEITVIAADSTFAAEVKSMFESDFERSRLMQKEDIVSRPFWFRVFSRAAYLTAPLL